MSHFPRDRFAGTSNRRTEFSRIGNYRPGRLTGQRDDPNYKIEADAAKTIAQQSHLAPPTNVWKRDVNGKFRFINSYATNEIAERHYKRTPRFTGEIVFLFPSGSTPTEEDFKRLTAGDKKVQDELRKPFSP